MAWCGPFPYVKSKESCLRDRGFLEPEVLGALYFLACDPKGCVERQPGFPHDRVAISRDSVTVVVSDHCGLGLPVILTAFVAGDPAYPAGAVLAAAGKIDHANLINLAERLRGAA